MVTIIISGRYRGPWDCLRSVVRQEGVRGCYRGLAIQGLRDVKASGIYFVIYHWWAGVDVMLLILRPLIGQCWSIWLLIGQFVTSTSDYWCLDNLASFYWQTKTKVSSLITGEQSEVKRESHNSEPTATEIFIAGGLAGLLSWQAIIYLDVIKSKIQADTTSHQR